jgi:hypothetical protein
MSYKKFTSYSLSVVISLLAAIGCDSMTVVLTVDSVTPVSYKCIVDESSLLKLAHQLLCWMVLQNKFNVSV